MKYRIAYGEPLLIHREYPKEAARDPDVVRAIAEKVRSRVQGMIDLGLELRKSSGSGMARSLLSRISG